MAIQSVESERYSVHQATMEDPNRWRVAGPGVRYSQSGNPVWFPDKADAEAIAASLEAAFEEGEINRGAAIRALITP